MTLRAAVVVLVGAWVLGGVASPVLAQTLDGGRFLPVEGPRLAGDELVWVPAYGSDRGYRVEVQPLSGAPARTIFQTAPRPERTNVFVNGLAASPEQVLVAERGSRLDGAADSEVIRIGLDGAVEALGDGCSGCGLAPIDLSGNVGIYNGSEPGATLRDFARPPDERELVSPVSGQMRVAGRYAAWEHAGDIVVYDRTARSELYRVSDVWPGFDSPRSLDLQADGKVAFLYSPDSNRTDLLAWASPAEPFPHRLAVDADRTFKVKLANDRVVFARDVTRLFSSRPDITVAFGELGVIGLAGGGGQVLVRPVESSFDFDFDGERVAWAARGCRGVLLRSKRLEELIGDPRARPVRRASGCRLRLLAPARTQRRERFLHFPVQLITPVPLRPRPRAAPRDVL